MNRPTDNQYITATILYLDKEAEVQAQYRAKQNDIIFDFYSGTGGESFENVIKWSPRKVDKVARHPWTNIENGI